MNENVFSQTYDQSYVEDENENEIEYVYVYEGHKWFCEYAEFEDGKCQGCESPGVCVDINNPPKRASFRVRRRYYDMIVSGEKTEEIRTLKPFWIKQLFTGNAPQVAVFVCGKDVHRRWITSIDIQDAEDVLGRQLSEQGQKDVLGPDNAIIIKLGSEFTVKSDSLRSNISEETKK